MTNLVISVGNHFRTLMLNKPNKIRQIAPVIIINCIHNTPHRIQSLYKYYIEGLLLIYEPDIKKEYP